MIDSKDYTTDLIGHIPWGTITATLCTVIVVLGIVLFIAGFYVNKE